MTSLKTTLGIELELIAVYPKNLIKAWFPDNRVPVNPVGNSVGDSVGIVIDDMLAAKGIPVARVIQGDKNDPTYSRWLVKGDDSVSLTEEEFALLPAGWSWEALELCSRKFNLVDEVWEPEINKLAIISSPIVRRASTFTLATAPKGSRCEVPRKSCKSGLP